MVSNFPKISLLKTVLLASPRGPCAGVNRALEIVEQAIQKYGTPIYANHEIVHNTIVVERLKKRGVIFGKSPEEIPPHSVFLYSAHGVSPEFQKRVAARNLHSIDATCPLVTKVHHEAKNYAKKGYTIFFIGHAGHPEVEGTMGIAPMVLIEKKEDVIALDCSRFTNIPLAVLTQTTLSLDETSKILSLLTNQFPNLETPKSKDICYATQNRQDAVKALAQKADAIVVLGSPKSSNSNRLVETARTLGCKAILAESFDGVPNDFFETIETLGISSGASVPEDIVELFLKNLQRLFPNLSLSFLETKKESLQFPLPAV